MCKEKKNKTDCWQEPRPPPLLLPPSPLLTAGGWSGSTEPKLLNSIGNALQDLGPVNRSSNLALGPLKGCQADGRGNVVTTNHKWALTERANYTQGTKTGICALSHETQKFPCRGFCSKGFKQQQQNVSISSQQQALVSHLDRQRLKCLKTQCVFPAHQRGP